MLLRPNDLKVANTYFQKVDKRKFTDQKKTTQKVVHLGTQKDTANLTIFLLENNGLIQSLICSQTLILTSTLITK